MRFGSISEIYDANRAVDKQFHDVALSISDEQAAILPDGETWTIRHIVEHVASVDDSMARICVKLLGKAEAEGAPASGIVLDGFAAKAKDFGGTKLKAPEFVEPSGTLTIADSLARMAEIAGRFEQLKAKFETFDGNSHTFPHPYFGPLSAIEWLVLMGQHKARHLRQIEERLA